MTGADKMAQLQKMGISRNVVLERTGGQKWVGLGSITMSVSLPNPFSFHSIVQSQHCPDSGAKAAGRAPVRAAL